MVGEIEQDKAALQLDIGNLANGYYFIQASINGEKVLTEKVVLNK